MPEKTKSYVVQLDWGTVAHEGSRESCETWVRNVVDQGFGRRSNFTVVDSRAEVAATIEAAKRPVIDFDPQCEARNRDFGGRCQRLTRNPSGLCNIHEARR